MLSGAELGLLSRLDLVYRRRTAGTYAGERRSPRAARSPEFSDFRPYVSGDDFRQIDWAAFARLEKLMLRLYVAEEEATLNVVVDGSASMEMGSPPKWPRAAKLAAAIAMLGLGAMDRVQVGVWGGDGSHTPPLRGREGTGRIWSYLEALQPSSGRPAEDPGRLRWLRPGMTVLISDFLGETAWNASLAGLRKRRQEVIAWQLLAPDEENPELSGDLKLVDPESGLAREVTVTAGLVAGYRQALAEHRQSLAQAVLAAGGRFLHGSSADELEGLMLAGLRAGVVRRS